MIGVLGIANVSRIFTPWQNIRKNPSGPWCTLIMVEVPIIGAHLFSSSSVPLQFQHHA